MPHQSFSIESLEIPFRPARRAACADFKAPELMASKRAPWLDARFGFMGSIEGFDLLRFEAPCLALTPNTAEAILAAGLIDVLVIESAQDDLTGEWGLSFLNWNGATPAARSVIALAQDLDIPCVAILRGEASQAPLFEPLARAADHVLVSQPLALCWLQNRGIKANLIAPAMQPALYHGFGVLKDNSEIGKPVLSLDLATAIDDVQMATQLDSLTPFGLNLCAPDKVIRKHRVETLPQALQDACMGTVTFEQARYLFTKSDLLVQIVRSDRDPGPEIQNALHAAASRCAVVVLGDLEEEDPRRGFAHVMPDLPALRLFVSRFVMDRIWAHLRMQETWRAAHRDHSACDLALHIARFVDPQVGGKGARPRATVLTPTFRPNRLQQVLDTFRAQIWEDKELIIVANTDTPEDWDVDLLRSDEQIIFLPRRFGPGTALNLGGTCGTGDYVMRVDDDDRYGAHYVEDMMLGAAALNPDMTGQSACLYFYVDEGRLVYLPRLLEGNEAYPSVMTGGGGHLAGFSHCVRRSVLNQVGGYPDGQHGGVDAGFIDVMSDTPGLLCTRADSLNAIVERRSDVSSHTWQTALEGGDRRFKRINMSLEELLA